MNIRAAKADLKVQEIPSHELERVHGESNLHVLLDGWRILKAITGEALLTALGADPTARWTDGIRSTRALVGVRTPPRATHQWIGCRALVVGRPQMISVVICAYTEKRWRETCAAVESVRAPELSRQGDHPGRRPQPDLYDSFARELPDVNGGREPVEQGLSGGKNTGVGLAHGEIVAFLDDDAVADPDWLKFFAASYADPAIMGVGGLTLPDVEGPAPVLVPPGVRLGRGLHVPRDGAIRRSRSGTCWAETPSFRREAFCRPADSKMASADPPASALSVVRRPSSASGSTRSLPDQCSCSTTGRRSGTWSRPIGAGSPTSCLVVMPRVSRRRWSRPMSVPRRALLGTALHDENAAQRGCPWPG